MCYGSQSSSANYVDNSSHEQVYPQAAIGYSQGDSLSGYSQQASSGFDLSSVQLPPPNMSCFQPASVGKGETRYLVTNEPPVYKTIELNYNLTKTVVKENTIHHQHNRNVYYNVNRNYNHLIRVVNNNNNYHHHLTNNIIRVNDIHHQRVEQVAGGSRNFNDYKQTQRIESGGCTRGDGSCGNQMAQNVASNSYGYPGNGYGAQISYNYGAQYWASFTNEALLFWENFFFLAR